MTASSTFRCQARTSVSHARILPPRINFSWSALEYFGASKHFGGRPRILSAPYRPRRLRWNAKLDPSFWRARWLVDLRYRRQLPSIQHLPGTAVLLNNPWCHNYYHWMLEVAPRVMLMRQAGLDADWYVVDCQSSYQKRALELMGVPLDRCIQSHYGLHLQADQLLRPSHPGLTSWQMMSETISRNVQDSRPCQVRAAFTSVEKQPHIASW